MSTVSAVMTSIVATDNQLPAAPPAKRQKMDPKGAFPQSNEQARTQEAASRARKSRSADPVLSSTSSGERTRKSQLAAASFQPDKDVSMRTGEREVWIPKKPSSNKWKLWDIQATDSTEINTAQKAQQAASSPLSTSGMPAGLSPLSLPPSINASSSSSSSSPKTPSIPGSFSAFSAPFLNNLSLSSSSSSSAYAKPGKDNSPSSPYAGDLESQGKQFFQNRQYEEAINSFRSALAKRPNNTYVQKLLFQAIVSLGDQKMAQGKSEEAQSHFIEAQKMNPNDKELNKKVLQAESSLSGSFSASPFSSSSLSSSSSSSSSSAASAPKAKPEGRASLPSPKECGGELEVLGNQLFQNGNYEEAANCYRSALAMRPNNVYVQKLFFEALVSLGDQKQTQGKFVEALAHFKEANKIRPNDKELNNKVLMMDLIQRKTVGEEMSPLG